MRLREQFWNLRAAPYDLCFPCGQALILIIILLSFINLHILFHFFMTVVVVYGLIYSLKQ